MRTTYKYRIYLTNGQRRILNMTLEECRWVYNQTLQVRQFAYENSITCSLYDTQALLPHWKAKRPSLKQVHSQVLQNVQVRVDLAFQAFFRRLKAGEEEVGYPRFKGFGRYDSITYPQYGNGVEIRDNDLVVSKLGRVQVVWHRPVEGTIKTVTLRRSATGKWYVTFSCQVEPRPLPPTERIVGVDMGLEAFATLSTGPEWQAKIENPRFFRRDEHDLKRLQRAKDAAKNTQNWPEHTRRKKALAHIHERIKFRRADFAHQQSRALINSFQIIVLEDLDTKDMLQNGRLAKSIADAAWRQLIRYTCAKAEEAGRTVVLIDPRHTSQLCSRCGQIVHKELSVRIHDCRHCGLRLDRDQNAAINILRRGLQNLRL